jgi:hypothetical protein
MISKTQAQLAAAAIARRTQWTSSPLFPRGLSALLPPKSVDGPRLPPTFLNQHRLTRSINVHLFAPGSNPNHQHEHSRL